MVFLRRNVFFRDTFVLIRYYTFHVWHAAIAYFEVASVANFSELVARIAKMFSNQSQKHFCCCLCVSVVLMQEQPSKNIS